MAKAEIKVDLSKFLPEFVRLLQRGQAEKVFTHTAAAIHALAVMYQETWRSFASGTPIPGIPRVINSRGPYIKSIQLDDSKTFVKVVYTDYPPHRYIEEGHPPIDLKPGLLSGPKARMGKEGPYNVVSFRHGTPGTIGAPMPRSIYREMLEGSKKADADKAAGLTGVGGRSEVIGRDQAGQRIYQWGFRLDAKHQVGRRSKVAAGYTWKSGKFAGMVRMDVSTSRARRSQYMTFRTVSFRSDPQSWIVPEQDPIPIREKVVEYVGSNVDVADMLSNALSQDLV